MFILAQILVAVVAALHLFFLLLEMVWWDTPRGHKAFNLDPDFATRSKALAANQGLYNGFLAAGLVWGLFTAFTAGAAAARPIETFFLICVIVAGAYGAATVSRRILIIQALPALVALGAVWLSS